MPHLHSLEGLTLKNSWLTIGVFDGVHRGHQSILQQLTAGAHASGAPAVVISFHPHPASVLAKLTIPCLTSPAERAELLMALGVEYVITLPFSRELAAQSPEKFMAAVAAPLGLRQLLIGYDFALGKNRAGTPERLTQIGKELGYETRLLPAIQAGGEILSSSRARALLQGGEVGLAADILGRFYTLTGPVVPGDGRGRTIGIPTANIDFPAEKLLPAYGVYACRALVGAKSHPAVVNIGLRPTFSSGDPAPRVEAHLLDVSADFYGQPMTLEFIQRLRGEQKFDSAAALVAQIHADIERTRAVKELQRL
ncbi:MAG: bifunctional riboflavin kinase/FAD synthetase [Anaerolineales bacterium]